MYTVKFCHVCRPYSASIHESSKDKETGSVQICQTSREILINPIHIPIPLKFFSNRNDISIVERSNRSLFFLYFSKIREKKRKNKKRNKISRFRLILILGRINHRARRIFLADRGGDDGGGFADFPRKWPRNNILSAALPCDPHADP